MKYILEIDINSQHEERFMHNPHSVKSAGLRISHYEITTGKI